ERYFFTCSRYIDLNPVKAHLVNDAKDYPWAAYGHLAHGKEAPIKIDTHSVYLDMGRNSSERQISYRALVMNYPETELDLMERRAGILGDNDFKNRIKETMEKVS